MEQITIETKVASPIATVWAAWTEPNHIDGWAFASPEWGAEAVHNDVQVGGTFLTKMFAKDCSAAFDFAGTYTAVEPPTKLAYDLGEARHVTVKFTETPAGVHITQSFTPETENPLEMQRAGWQAFLDNFKSYVEGLT